MPALKNPRHERFAQELAKGRTQEQAYEAAGYRPSRPNACKLAADHNILQRVAEIQERGAIRSEITIEELTGKLMALATKAEGMPTESGVQASRACLMDAAKLNGLVVDKKLNAETTVEDLLARIHARRSPA